MKLLQNKICFKQLLFLLFLFLLLLFLRKILFWAFGLKRSYLVISFHYENWLWKEILLKELSCNQFLPSKKKGYSKADWMTSTLALPILGRMSLVLIGFALTKTSLKEILASSLTRSYMSAWGNFIATTLSIP